MLALWRLHGAPSRIEKLQESIQVLCQERQVVVEGLEHRVQSVTETLADEIHTKRELADELKKSHDMLRLQTFARGSGSRQRSRSSENGKSPSPSSPASKIGDTTITAAKLKAREHFCIASPSSLYHTSFELSPGS
jgi:hypothetical protein